MAFTNIEIKARTENSRKIREILQQHHARFHGIDEQEDTYFKTSRGRLKLRRGNIENTLIFYERDDQQVPKQSQCTVVEISDGAGIKDILEKTLGVWKVVCKTREIYFIDNIKFHLDALQDFGHFVEIEASNMLDGRSSDILHEQCNYYRKLFEIQDEDLIKQSYSDM